jgi:hypothetical protein
MYLRWRKHKQGLQRLSNLAWPSNPFCLPFQADRLEKGLTTSTSRLPLHLYHDLALPPYCRVLHHLPLYPEVKLKKTLNEPPIRTCSDWPQRCSQLFLFVHPAWGPPFLFSILFSLSQSHKSHGIAKNICKLAFLYFQAPFVD